MMIIEPTFLAELFEGAGEDGMSQVLARWRAKTEAETARCQACPYERMMGRRCCCLCLEASLHHTPLRLRLDFGEEQWISAAGAAIKTHRYNGCAHCDRTHND